MVFSAARSARNAENDRVNDPGMCLQQVRLWDGIEARYLTAASAWRNTNDRHPKDRQPPRGCDVYWTGGSEGSGHVAKSLGDSSGKFLVRSSDAGGRGLVATVDLGWFERNWHLTYAGWSWDTNEVTIPHHEAKVNLPNPNIKDAIASLDKAITANSKDKAYVADLTHHRDGLKKLAKKK